MSSIDTVVFDIGNVLIPWDPRWLYRKLLPDDEAIERFLREVDFQAWNLRHDAGQPFALGIAEHGDRFPHYRPLLQAYFDRFEESMGSAIAGTLALVRQLRASGYRTLALTNFSAETFRRTLARYPFLNEFEGIVVSGEEHLVKPDPEIYQRLCSRYGVEPARSVFIDDSAPNVAGAQNIGMHALRFSSPEKLRIDLATLGVRVPDTAQTDGDA